jgi:hypothetical protein
LSEQKWYHDLTEKTHYRVTTFRHPMGRVMEEWYSSTGEMWYLDPGMTLDTLLHDHILTPCDPVPGMLSKKFEQSKMSYSNLVSNVIYC